MGEPGFLKARNNSRAGTYTVWATEDARGSFEALVVERGAEEGVVFETVINDLASMEDIEARVLDAIPANLRDGIQRTEIEPDRLVIVLADGDPASEQIASLAEQGPAKVIATGALVELDVQLAPRSENTTGLCPDRSRCAPVGGGIALQAPGPSLQHWSPSR